MLAAALAGAAGMIGFQAEFRLNAIHDRATVERLRKLVPEPPPNTLFLPLQVDTHGGPRGGCALTVRFTACLTRRGVVAPS